LHINITPAATMFTDRDSRIVDVRPLCEYWSMRASIS